MGISNKTNKVLWGKAASRCSFPDCKLELTYVNTATSASYTIGEAAHIISKNPNGPRYDPTKNINQLNQYFNLILLCPNHHKVIDNEITQYTVDVLLKMKEDHEKWVRETLKLDLSVKSK